MSNPKPVEGTRNAGLEEAAQICESWGDQCAGGSGREIVPSVPNKGQMYGQAYYNLAESIRRAMKPVEAALSAAPARDGVRPPELESAIERLTAMVDDGCETWDLSPNDKDAITTVLRALAAKEQADGQPHPSAFAEFARLPKQEAVMDDWTNHQNHVEEYSDSCHLCIERKFGPEVAKAMQRYWNRKKEIETQAWEQADGQ